MARVLNFLIRYFSNYFTLHHSGLAARVNLRRVLFRQHDICRLASVGILGKEREPGVGKLGWHGNFDTGFKKNISSVFR